MRNLYYLLGIIARMKQLFGGAGVFLIAFLATMVFLVYTADAGTYTNVTASRSFDTTYENESGSDMLVQLGKSCFGSSAQGWRADIGADATWGDPWESDPFVANSASTYGIANSRSGNFLFFIVPSGYFYRVINSGCTTELYWIEYTMDGGSGSGTSSSMTINNPTQDMFNGIVLFGFVTLFFIWFFRRPYDTF